MSVSVSFLESQNIVAIVADALIVAIGADNGFSPTAEAADRATGGALRRAVEASCFSGEAQESLELIAPAGLDLGRVLLLGLGDPEDAKACTWQDWSAKAYNELAGSGATHIALAVEPMGGPIAAADAAAEAAFGLSLAAYRFDRYRTSEKPQNKPSVNRASFLVEGADKAAEAHRPLAEIAAGVALARDLVSEPANVLYPESLAERCMELSAQGVDVEIMDEAKLEAIGMRTLLAVGRGSARDSRVVVMRWTGHDDENAAPIALVGKGVTFDTGGISIKPAGGMEDMKWDMAGSAAVIGAMRALAGRNARANVIGIVGLVENMPSATAQRPGDVVESLSGQTVEVINTDAEGRLVLCDLLTYVQNTYKPQAIVDLATLTGAIIVSLGHYHAGLFSNNDDLSKGLSNAGREVGEAVWRLPLGEEYDKALKSDIADMKNVGGREGGSITAAQFLQRFIEKDTPWAHLDIAGMAWAKTEKPTVPKGGTGFGVRLLDRLVADRYEQR